MKAYYNGIVCNVTTDRDFSTAIGELCPEAVAYALCRMFVRTPVLCRRYVTESYRMRLATGKARRPRRYDCTVSGRAAEINAAQLRVWFTVSPDGITVTKVRVL